MHFFKNDATVTVATTVAAARQVLIHSIAQTGWESKDLDYRVMGEDDIKYLLDDALDGALPLTLTSTGVNLETGEEVVTTISINRDEVTVSNNDKASGDDFVIVRFGADFVTDDLEDLTRRVTLLAKEGVREIRATLISNKVSPTEASVVRGFMELIIQKYHKGDLDFWMTVDRN